MDNYSDAAMVKSNFERIDADFYPTPASVTQALIPFLFADPFSLTPDVPVYECACGMGHMSEVLKTAFNTVISSDLYFYGYRDGYAGIDFYALQTPYAATIITNPPYAADAEKFVRKGLELTKPYNGILALLMRKEFDSAVTRNDLFNRTSPFTMKIDLLWRPIWFPDDERQQANPRHNFSWYVWDWRNAGKLAFLEYADRPNRQIRGKRK